MKIIEAFLDTNGKISTSKIRSCDPAIMAEIYRLTSNLDPGAGIPERLYWLKHSLTEYPKKCLTCGAPVKRFYSFSKGYVADYCSTRCARRSPLAEQKKKQTIKQRYGVDSIWQVDSILAKREATCLERYGKPNTLHIARQAFLTQSGVEHVSAAPGVLEKRLATIRAREVERLTRAHKTLKIDPVTYVDSDTHVKFECLACGTVSFGRPDKLRCPTCDHDATRSDIESLIVKKIAQRLPGVEILQNKKHDELNVFPDIFIPAKNLIIELDGNYWHAEGRGGDKLKSYKRKKIISAAGINSLFFFEDEVLKKGDIVTSMILSKLGVFDVVLRASKCQVELIPSALANSFLTDNHLTGAVRSTTQLGLFHGADLVAVATFGRPRFNKTARHELLRLCFKKNVKVHGGASKLLASARALLPGTMLSYSDNRYSDGKVYATLGFEKVSSNPPSYFYVSKKDYLTRMSRMRFQKHKLVKLGGDPALTEWENAQRLGLDRIYDCGSTTWLLR